MLIGNKVFPYPLLRDKDSNTDYKTTQFYFDFEKNGDAPIVINDKLILKNIRFYLDNQEMHCLYENGEVKVICEIECSNTVYREYFELTEQPVSKEFPISNFSNVVTISAYVVAVKKITNYTSNDFNEDFLGYHFHFNPSNILAADDGFKFRVDIDESNENKMASIFTIVKREDAGGIVTYNSESDKIVIYLNPETYNIYDTMKNHSMYNNMFFASLVIPVLSNCLQDLQKKVTESDSMDDLCDEIAWFRSVLKRYAHVKGKPLDIEEFGAVNSYELAQLLMNESTEKCVKDFYKLANSGEEEQDDE